MHLRLAVLNDNYLNPEVLLNNLKLVSINSGTELAIAVALVNSSGTQIIPGAVTSATATLSNVASSASNVTLLASNASRLGAIFFNDSTSQVYVKFGATATSSSFTYKMNPSDTLELNGAVYTGIIDAIWVSANGSMRCTELT